MNDPDEFLLPVKERGHFILYADIEKVTTKNASKGSRVLVITESTLFVYHKKSKKLISELSFLFLNKMTHKNNRIKLEFSDDVVTIDSQNAQKVIKKLNLVLCHFLTEAELEQFGLTKPEKQSNFSILMRMHAIIKLKQVTLDHSVMSTLTKTILYQYPRLALSDGNPNAVHVLLRILPLCTFITEVHFPEFEFNEDELAWLTQCRHLRFVSLTGPVDRNVVEFLTSVHLSSCAFSRSDMSIDDLKAIKSIPGVGNGFHKAFSLTTFQYFTTEYLALRNLAVLNMDATPNLNVRAVLQSLGNIVLLSMAYCNLEVSNTIHDLEMFDLKKLRYVNLSGNRCNLRVNDVSKMPPLLFGMNVSGVQWGDGCLVSFFEMAFKNFPNGLRLSVGDGEATYREWADLAAFFAGVESTTLASLSWNGNPVTPQFIRLLGRSPNIEHLSVNRCFKYLESKVILKFAKTLRLLTRLKYFCARGSKSYFFGPYLYLILTALLRCPVEIVDIRNSGCGDICVDRLKEFILRHPTLKVVDVDGVVPTDFAKYVAFVREIHKRPGLMLSYPENDISKITDENLASTIKGMLVLDGDSHVGKPFHVYRYVEAPSFPRVVSEPVLSALRQEGKGDPQKELTLEEVHYIEFIPPVLSSEPEESVDEAERADADLDQSPLSDGSDDQAGPVEHAKTARLSCGDDTDLVLNQSENEDAGDEAPPLGQPDEEKGEEPQCEVEKPEHRAMKRVRQTKTPKTVHMNRRMVKTCGQIEEKPGWEMPELVDTHFDQNVWPEKGRHHGAAALTEKREDEEEK